MNKNKPDQKPEDTPEEESLAERSARLEAEAAEAQRAKAEAAAGFNNEEDPLAPGPAPAGEGESPEMEALQAELEQARDQLMRALAEAENTRKRAARDREESSKYAISGFARDLLSVADNLRRALDAVPDDAKEDVRIQNLVEGIEATERELLKTFEKNGVEKLDPMDQLFDPNLHEVMFEVPGSGRPPGTIVQVMETGYTLHDRLLRPARVGVAKDDGGNGGGEPPPSKEPGDTLDTEA